MLRLFSLCTLVTVLIVSASPIAAEDKKKKKFQDKEDVFGAIWEYKLTKDKKEETGRFHLINRDILIGGKRIGVLEPKKPGESTLIFTNHESLNGKVAIKKVKADPPVWTGKLMKDDGTEWHFRIELKDR